MNPTFCGLSICQVKWIPHSPSQGINISLFLDSTPTRNEFSAPGDKTTRQQATSNNKIMETVPEGKMDHQFPQPNAAAFLPTAHPPAAPQRRLSPLRRPLTTHTPLGSPIHSTRLRSNSVGSVVVPSLPWNGSGSVPVMSPYTTRSLPVSPFLHTPPPGSSSSSSRLHHHHSDPASATSLEPNGGIDPTHGGSTSTCLQLPSLPPPEPSEAQKAMEAASAKERARAKALEKDEIGLNADELRLALRRERQRSSKMAADLAALRALAVQSQFEAEVLEEGRINGLMRRLDILQQEKGRIIVELEREEEMVRNIAWEFLTRAVGESTNGFSHIS